MTIRSVIGVLVVVLLLAMASIAYIAAHNAPSSSAPHASRAVSTSTSRTVTNTATQPVASKTTTVMQEGLVSPIYRRLGYPIIHYYVPKELGLGDEEVAAVYAVHACGSEEPIGYINIEGLLSLRQALQRALSVLGSNYSLVRAEYMPGLVVNDTLVKRPRWVLVLAKTYKGYRLWPRCCGDTTVEVDALNGSVKLLQRGNYTEPKSPVPLPGQDKLVSTSPEQLVRRALRQILSLYRGWGRQVLEDALTNKTRYDYSIDLRIARLGDESNELLSAQSTVTKEFIGQPRLYWVITIEADHVRASALVDTVTGRLASYIVEPLWPRTPWAELRVEPTYPGKPINITRSIKGLGETTVTLVHVLSAEPGEKGTLALVAYWRTHVNPAAIKTAPKIILEPKTIETQWIKLTPLNYTVIIEPSIGARNKILYEYRVSTSASPGIYVAEIKLGEQVVGYQNTSRCIPLAVYVEK